MPYSISKGKTRIRKQEYYTDREIAYLKKKHKNKRLSFPEITREGTKYEMKVGETIHTKGTFVEYKGKMYAVLKPEKNGVWLVPIKEGGMFETEKPVFVKEKDYLPHTYPMYNPPYAQMSVKGGVFSAKDI